ncbi:MAG: chemotaxis protein CheW [Synechococcales bacterium]|nr:chemotaxis protein CheW [Synechococcales bacterium]
MSDNNSELDARPLPALVQEQPPAVASDFSEQFLRLRLAADTLALLPIRYLGEVLTISTSQVIPIPHMPPWVMGVYNWRGEILWMVDLGHLLGLPTWYQQASSFSTLAAILLYAHEADTTAPQNRQTVGLVVYQAEDMEWCNPNQVQAPIPLSATPELTPFLQGYWWTSNDEMLAVLDREAIIAAISNSQI